MRAPDGFGAFLALGLTAMIVVQAFVNISVVLGLMPTKGIPLPLVSAGGSSLLINLLAIGVLLNVSQHAAASTGTASAIRQPGWDPAPEPPPAPLPGWSPAA
jgi:cell division protein FtsW